MSEIKNEKTKEKIEQIKRFWDEKARTFKTDPTATLGDSILKDIEAREIIKFVKNGQKVLDCGCGNGTSSIQIASKRSVDLIGIDYSEDMIEMANVNLSVAEPTLKSKVRFEKGDVLNLNYEKDNFDTVITVRCLQNLPTFELQKQAIMSIKRPLKIGGHFLMLECSHDGLTRLNKTLKYMGVAPVTAPWHNLFFNDNDLFVLAQEINFPLIKVINVSGVYQLLALGINYRLRHLAKFIPPFLNIGYHKLYLWEKQN